MRALSCTGALDASLSTWSCLFCGARMSGAQGSRACPERTSRERLGHPECKWCAGGGRILEGAVHRPAPIAADKRHETAPEAIERTQPPSVVGRLCNCVPALEGPVRGAGWWWGRAPGMVSWQPLFVGLEPLETFEWAGPMTIEDVRRFAPSTGPRWGRS